MNKALSWQVVIIVVVVIAAYTALAFSGHDTAGLVGAVVTLASVLGLGVHASQNNTVQNAALAKIEAQTNGVLDKRILEGSKAAMREVLAERPAVVVHTTEHRAKPPHEPPSSPSSTTP